MTASQARPIYLFLVRVEFRPFANPAGTTARFEEALKVYLKGRRLHCLIGGQGGTACTYGVVYRKRWGVKEDDRVALAKWISAQRICATVKLGDLQEDSDSTDLIREITEWVFQVDNLTKRHRSKALRGSKQRRKQLEILKLFGKIDYAPDYDYKKERKRLHERE
jgi:hypothetical protein